MIRNAITALLFAAILAGGLRPSILRLLLPPHRPPDVPGNIGAIERTPLRLKNDPTPSDVLQFLDRVRADTKDGERVSLLMAWPHDGWSYAHWRASYVLAGRVVLAPKENIESETPPDVVALWGTGWGDPRYAIVWADDKSAMLRRTR